MNRLAARLATKAALLGGGAGPTWPTIATDNVFDSRQDEIDVEALTGAAPVIIVRTDRDERSEVTQNGAGARTLDMRLEFGVLAKLNDSAGVPVVDWPATDMQLEAFLDLLEFQIEAALFGPTEWAKWWVWQFKPGFFASTPLFVPTEKGRIRAAAREMVVTFDKFDMDILPPMQRTDDDPYAAVLPPGLVEVMDRIAVHGGGDLKATTAELRALLEAQELPGSGIYPPLIRVIMGLTQTDAVTRPGDAERVTADLLRSMPT